MISAIRSSAPPGSTTTASLVSAHATIEQLHCSGPAGNVSTSSTRRPCHRRPGATPAALDFAVAASSIVEPAPYRPQRHGVTVKLAALLHFLRLSRRPAPPRQPFGDQRA